MHPISIVFICFINMVQTLYFFSPEYRFAYPEKVEFSHGRDIIVYAVIPNNDEGLYFKIRLNRRDYDIGHDAVEGFVNPKQAFMIEIDQGVGPTQMFISNANPHHCFTCGVLPEQDAW